MDFHLPYQQHPYEAFPQHHSTSPSMHAYPAYGLPIRSSPYDMARSVSMTQLAMESHQQQMERNDTKPRLAKAEVDLLESHFQENHKPPSSLKRELAAKMNVDVSRINNWFQNRRAKAKQEQKQLNYDLRNASAQPYSEEADSPDNYQSADMFEDNFTSTPSQPSQNGVVPFSLSSGLPPAPVSSCNPQYDDPTAASIDSLHRTMAEADAAAKRGEFAGDFSEQTPLASHFGGSMYNAMQLSDRAQFPPPASAPTDFEEEMFNATAFSLESVAMQSSEGPFFNFESVPMTSSISMPFPSQLMAEPTTFATVPVRAHTSHSMHTSPNYSPEGLNTAGFRSPPPPADIASRRNQRRPAPIGTEALGDHASMGPRTVSHSTIPKRLNRSPTSNMRRVVSVGANLNVLSGRVQKTNGFNIRSPLQRNFSGDSTRFITAQGIKNMASISPIGRAPPTPNSPHDHLTRQERSPASSEDAGAELETFIYHTAGPTSFGTPALGINMASPPETPLNVQLVGTHWGFDVNDETLHTPSFGSFPTDAPHFTSQPATPAFGYFPNHASPQFDVLSTDAYGVAEQYRFPESTGGAGGGAFLASSTTSSGSASTTPEQSKPKAFTFHNATLNDYAAKGISPTM